ncbi:MAG TPA: gluconokinase [Bryobacteraceae bacterium]|nr:gluconokinase [Bryobacteraceae bacterium]
MDCVLTLDVGSSSARTLLFDFDGRQIQNFGSQVEYRAHTTADGGWEIDAAELTGIVTRAIDAICEQMRTRGVKPAAVATDTFWHSIVGVDGDGNATTPILHPFDTRSAAAAKELARRVDNRAQHARTGCVLHPSYPPAKLLWLSQARADAFKKTKRWMSAGEFLFLRLIGKAAASTSMVSATGLWDQNRNDYDSEMLAALPVSREQFAQTGELDKPVKAESRWPELSGIPWFPALGDGACDNLGSGCVTRDCFALMVGTSGAMRAIVDAERIDIPAGLFCYRLDPKRFVLGGALSNGGAVFAWAKRTLCLPADNGAIEAQLAALPPVAHGLTVLPLFAGERSIGWRADARAAITGLSTNTSPIEILQAALESVALRFRNVYELMRSALGEPREIVASGSALLHSPVWTQMMADALEHGVILCLEPEATSRGTALMALERLGVKVNPGAHYGDSVQPVAGGSKLYIDALARQRALYGKLFQGD